MASCDELLPPSSGQVWITTRLTSRSRQSGGASETSAHFHQTTRRHVPQDINHYRHKNMENLLALLHCEDGGAKKVRNVRKYSDNDTGWRHIPDDVTFSHTVVRSSDHSLTHTHHSLNEYQSMDHILFHCENTREQRYTMIRHTGAWPTSKQNLINKHQKIFSRSVESIDFDDTQQSAQ